MTASPAIKRAAQQVSVAQQQLVLSCEFIFFDLIILFVSFPKEKLPRSLKKTALVSNFEDL